MNVECENILRGKTKMSKGKHVAVRIGGREIAECRSNPGQDRKQARSHRDLAIPLRRNAAFTTTYSYTTVTKLLRAKSAPFPRANTSWCGLVGVKL